MFCFHCGHPLPADAFFCPNCGQKTENGSTPGTAQRSAPPNASTSTEPPPKIDCGLSLAIIAVVTGGVIGIVALVYAVLAKDMLNCGNYEGARRRARIGKIWSWTAIILAAIGYAATLLLLPRIVEAVAPGLMEI